MPQNQQEATFHQRASRQATGGTPFEPPTWRPCTGELRAG